MSRQRVAVIGAGVSGLTAAYLLQRSYDVLLFEADDRLGGHAYTHDVATSEGTQLAVDSGFIVHNERTYPNLLRLFGELGVATQDSEMSMSVRCDGCGLEYAGGKGAGGVTAQPRAAGEAHDVDKVVVATHADQALDLLGDPTGDERRVLGAFGYSRNETWLHADDSVLPAAGRRGHRGTTSSPAAASRRRRC